MNGHSYDSPSKQTIQALDHVRAEFAETRGVTRNAVDQLFAGNTKDDYPPFRQQFRDVCLTKGSNPEAYLDDLQGIYQATRGGSGISVTDAHLNKLSKAHKTIEAMSRALADGQLDYGECVSLIPLLSATVAAAEVLKQTVIDRKNELANMPNREFAQYANRRPG